ncbi:signal transduction protein [Streptomyces sp. NBRC 110611]|uniref:sensor histidine kinase n=1 Tax=Streptomyces sp. NBRC 110611 TaxID=1621259 RepID=UPI00082D8741|nr:histidine kinase [Streptomyces sp. NBRC 110611]GAU65758.1 signal transduction protein [Streptomyces sp. NBRC 110611]
MKWYTALCESRWKNTVLAVVYGIPLIEIALALPDAGLVPDRTVGLLVSVAIAVGTVWRERVLLPYSAVSVAGVVITGHLLSTTVACYTAVRQGRHVLAAILVLVSLVFALATPEVLTGHAPHAEATLSGAAVIVLVPVLLGHLAKVNKKMAELTVEQRAREALLQEGRLREAALQQRERLVRDIHNGVGRQITLMVLQAGAIAVRKDASEPVKERCRLISEAGRDAVDALREIVTLAKTPDPADAPPAGRRYVLTDLAPVIGRYRSGGHRITVNVRISPSPPDPATQDLAYRIVTEGLSNAARHARGAAVDVRIDQTHTEVTVTVRNEAPPPGGDPLPGTGNGLVWLRDEVRSAGGTLHTAPGRGGGFVLRARLPGPASRTEETA